MILCIGLFLASRYMPLSEPRVDYLGLARDGQPLVAAVTRFHTETGLWPEDTVDLVPDYLDQRPDQHWYLEPDGTTPCLLRKAPQGRAYVRFDFTAGGPDGGVGWKKINFEGKVSALDLPTPSPTTAPAPLPAAQLWANKIKVLERRIARTHGHGVVDYYRTKASLLHRLGRDDQIPQVLEQARLAVPNHYWPLLAAAVLDPYPVLIPESLAPASRPATTSAPATAPVQVATTGTATPTAAKAPPALPPAQRLVEWARETPSFTHYFYLAWFYDRRETPNAGGFSAKRGVRLALEEACKYPLELDEDDAAKYAFYGFDACRLAYRVGAYDTVLKIAEQWRQRAALDGPKRDESYLAWRAAAELALGQLDTARADAAAAVEHNKEYPLWADHLDELAAAAQRADTRFIYPPAAVCGATTSPATTTAPRPRVPTFELFEAE